MDPLTHHPLPSAPVPDGALVRRMADRDATALIEMQRRYRGSVYAQAFGILWDAERAELVVTRAFEQLWYTAVRLNTHGNRALAWLQKTAAELAMAERNSRRHT